MKQSKKSNSITIRVEQIHITERWDTIPGSNMIYSLSKKLTEILSERRQPLQLNAIVPCINGIIRLFTNHRSISSAASKPDPDPMRGHGCIFQEMAAKCSSAATSPFPRILKLPTEAAWRAIQWGQKNAIRAVKQHDSVTSRDVER